MLIPLALSDRFTQARRTAPSARAARTAGALADEQHADGAGVYRVRGARSGPGAFFPGRRLDPAVGHGGRGGEAGRRGLRRRPESCAGASAAGEKKRCARFFGGQIRVLPANPITRNICLKSVFIFRVSGESHGREVGTATLGATGALSGGGASTGRPQHRAAAAHRLLFFKGEAADGGGQRATREHCPEGSGRRENEPALSPWQARSRVAGHVATSAVLG